MSRRRIPNPGSPEALSRGCRCPVIDNCHGRGYRDGPGFITDGDCPLHNEEKNK